MVYLPSLLREHTNKRARPESEAGYPCKALDGNELQNAARAGVVLPSARSRETAARFVKTHHDRDIIEDNPSATSSRKGIPMNKQTLIDHLNQDLAGELGAIIQYITYAAKATGPYRPQLSQFFLTEVADEQLHAQYLANKIVALGGEPATQPRPVPPARNNQEMLEAVLTAERQATHDYTQRAKEAEEFGDKGLVVQLEDMVRDESGHSEETERILRDWPL
jgi:bacterioferritin